MLFTIRILILVALLLPATSHTATLYKWIDAEGNISYQDSPPPDESRILEQRELADANIDERDQYNRRLAKTQPIDLFTTENCDVCELVRFNLNQLGIPFNEQTLFENKPAQEQLRERSGGLNAPSLFIANQLVTSYSLTSLKTAAINAGYRPKNATTVRTGENNSDMGI